MKLSLVLLLIASMLGASCARQSLNQFGGRWYFDEEATAKEWPARAKSEEQRKLFNRVAESLKKVRTEFGSPMIGVIDVSSSELLAHDGVMNPRYDVLSIVEKAGVTEIHARHFQVPDDDNPKVVLLKLSLVDERLAIEHWENDELVLVYVLTKKKA